MLTLVHTSGGFWALALARPPDPPPIPQFRVRGTGTAAVLCLRSIPALENRDSLRARVVDLRAPVMLPGPSFSSLLSIVVGGFAMRAFPHLRSSRGVSESRFSGLLSISASRFG